MAKITVYSSPSCPDCIKAKEFLKEKGMEFGEIDVTKDQEAAKRMVEKSGQMRLPVIEIDDVMIAGFNKKEIEEKL